MFANSMWLAGILAKEIINFGGTKQKENELHVYSIDENEHIGTINASLDNPHCDDPVVLVDFSSTAADAAERFVKEVLPLVMSKLEHWDSSVDLITFGGECVHKSVSKADLSGFDLKGGGPANIGPAIEKLRLYFERQSPNSFYQFNVLTISVGEISDRENAERESKKLTDFLATVDGWRINSQAVRLFTTSSDHQPDTKALSYLLQINNTTEVNICDVNVTSSNETIANEIAALFSAVDHHRTILDIEKPIISRFPWNSFQFQYFTITSGWHIFWMKQLPTATDAIKLQGKPINAVVEGQLTLAKFQQLMGQILPRIVSHMKILKIVGTAEANETVDQIFLYFSKTEDALAVQCSTTNNKIITNALADIATCKLGFRDSAEMMEFYRNHNTVIEDQIEKERLKKEEEDRVRLEAVELLKRKEEFRLGPEKKAAAVHKIAPNNHPNSVQTVFILDERSYGANGSQRLMEKIVPLMMSNVFSGSLELVHQVTFVRYKSTAAEMLQSLVQTLDPANRTRISILTNGAVYERKEMENFTKTVEDFLSGSGYSFELHVVRVDSTLPTHKQYKVVDINANESNEFIAEQILSMSMQ